MFKTTTLKQSSISNKLKYLKVILSTAVLYLGTKLVIIDLMAFHTYIT